ncbi:MAG: metallophosphoesterase [candidate division KSB1 bacterium]|nr:metallophosphoesterase [candidate division KSB1 bacterium]
MINNTSNNNGEIQITDERCNLIVISDLHLGEGFKQEIYKYSIRENFFYDEEFADFLQYLREKALESGQRWKLIINGDLFDFPRVVTIPQGKELEQWYESLKELGRDISDLPARIDKSERKYGLRTVDFKSVWKLMVIYRGHPIFFQALANFILEGHRLVIILGNHDVEFYCPLVQEKFLRLLSQSCTQGNHKSPQEILEELRSRVEFCPRAYIIEDSIYLEHGHQYDRLNRVDLHSLKESDSELKMPLGSFLNRYLLNHIETMLPFINNIKPVSEVVNFLIKKRTSKALGIIFHYVPLTILNLLRYHKYFSLWLFLSLISYPVAILFFVFTFALPHLFTSYKEILLHTLGGTGEFLFNNWVLALGIALSLFHIPGIFRFFSIVKGKKYLHQEAQKIVQYRPGWSGTENGREKFVIFGHTHLPDIKLVGNHCWSINSGTWVSVYDPELKLIRDDQKFAFILFTRNSRGHFNFSLLRWNDDARQADRLTLIDKES